MSHENVEIVRRAFEAVCRRPRPDFETINTVYSLDHEFVPLIRRIEGGVAEGGRGFRDWLSELDESWEGWEIKLAKVRGIDADRVLVDTVFTGLSKRGRVPVQHASTALVSVREGKIVRTELYSSVEQALEAVGLAE